MWIIDASVAVKWFFEHERDSEVAEVVLRALIDTPHNFFVPDLFFIECAAVIYKKSKDGEFTTQAIEKLQALGIHTVPVGQELLAEAIGIAESYGLSVYDGIYVAAGLFLKACWLTADLKAVKPLKNGLAMDLRDFLAET